MTRTFDDLVAEAESVSVDGRDFSWPDGRATEQRPSWGYHRLLGERLARVLQPGGTYLSQQVGPASVFELVEYFLGPQPEQVRRARHPDDAVAGAGKARLEVVDLRAERPRTEFHDIGAVIYFLRKVIWMVPGFTVGQYRDRLRELHERIEREGPFVAHTARFLIEARKTG
ncbi:hypothetical protein AB0B01_00010 [Streptomyces sp. NPDC044571]|uniref:hypothetical protein n=1 Tax=Streptomyces sp. NPDC044571 TaxID=3155371 RepID=UPI0033F468A0